jgi:hypothetical protein
MAGEWSVSAIKPTSSPAAGAALKVCNAWDSRLPAYHCATSGRERPVFQDPAGSIRP